ncbi:DotU family type IV/VI secretion system protein, partial [Pseudomonas putida]|nr:DotU family type IV/VI secretion system protein [Pseudomonas putida]MBF8714676.1 DotU family type IV/VI secretion system protein [Pseudomonas putida]
MPGPSAVRPGKSQAANAAHDVTESSLHAMLDVPGGTDSPYPPDQGWRADHQGYPADPDFQLRGGFANLMLDAANPLFGLVIRLRTLDDLPNIEQVHKTLQTQVSAIREEIQQ